MEPAIADFDVLTGSGEAEKSPYGPGLMEVADQHFAFLTAYEDTAAAEAAKDKAAIDRFFSDTEPVPESPLPEPNLELRLGQMEKTMLSMQAALDRIAGQAPRGGGGGFRKGVEFAAPSTSKTGSLSGKPLRDRALPGLGPSAVSAARSAGIPEDQLKTLSQLLAKSNQMQDTPTTPRKSALRKATNVLSETEEEEEEEDPPDALFPDSGENAGPPIEQAVIHLTRLVDRLAKGKDKKTKDVEALLDGVDGEGGDPSGSSGGKSKAAVYKKLRACLKDNPKFLFNTIQELMEQDFHVLQSAPGSSSQMVSWRAWLERRSRIGPYPTTIRFCWILGGILDSLQNGAVGEAKARAALGMLAADQAALDNGSWLMAQEALLEEPPPMASFKNKTHPEAWEQTGSRLMDDRWLEVLMWRIKNRDSYLESRKRLGPGRKEGNGGGTEKEKDGQHKKKKGGGKGDKAGQSKGSEASQSQGTA